MSRRSLRSSNWFRPTRSKLPIYAGNAIETVQSTNAKKIITVRSASFPVASQGNAAAVEIVSAAADPGISSFVENKLSDTNRPELTSAKIIISGGRALGSAEKFQEVILPIADKLGAAVDAGHAPNDWQVGQTEEHEEVWGGYAASAVSSEVRDCR